MNNSDYMPLSPSMNNHGSQNLGIIHSLALYSVLIFIFLIPWGDGLWDGLAKIFGILSFGMATLLIILHGTHRNYTYFHFFIVAFWTWIIVSSIWSFDQPKAMTLVPRVLQFMLLPFLFTIVITTRKNIILAYQAYVFGAVVASLIILYNYKYGIQSPYYNRYTVKNIETDSMSILLAVAIPMAAYLTSALDKKWKRIINIIVIPLIFFGIFLTGTRTGSIVGVIGILYWLFTYRHSSFKIKTTILIAFVLSIVTVFSFAPKSSIDRVFSAGKSLKSGDLNYRTVIWKSTIQQWKKTPIAGVGLGGLGAALSKEHVNFDASHNTYIHLLAEFGIIGLTLYVMLIISILYLIIQSSFNEKIFLLSLFLVSLVSQLTLHLHLSKETWFVFTMLVIHAINSRKGYSDNAI